jgi:hypothetical protein
MYMKSYFLLIAALITIGSGCRKDKEEKPACRISILTSPAGKEIKITYNAEGEYAKIENGESGQTNIPAYNAGSIIYTITNSNTGTLRKRITILLNNSGMATSLQQEQYSAGGTLISMSSAVYEYNGTELVKRTYTVSGGSSETVDTYNWTNGNMTSSNNGIYSNSMEYYTERSAQQGDWLNIMNLINSGLDQTKFIKNKNLLKNHSGSLLTYRFDAEGKIDALFQDGNLLYNIEYECK